jgi:nucleotide-binding universal stress UspA family protein
MERLCDFGRGFGARVCRAEVRVGRASDVIRQYAADVGADLIVVGPHGMRSRRSLLLGTTANSLVRNATVPVLIGSRTLLRGRTRVIAGVVDAPVSARVLAWAGAAARHLSARLTIIHAIEPAAYAHMASMVAAQSHGEPAVEAVALDAARQLVAERWLNESRRAHIDPSHVDVFVREGVADEVILERASRERAALVVLGSHENTPSVLARIGRSVRHVLHGARCAVLVVTPN